MPKSISQVQQSAIDDGFLNTKGDGEGGDEKLGMVPEMLKQYGEDFLKALGVNANKKKVVASGKLLSESHMQLVGDNVLQIIVPDYFDFPNEGVQGVKSSKNAPGSPYKFKNYGMNEEGRASIKKYIEDGHAKIDTVVKNHDKALGIGREKKHLSLIDTKTNQLIFMIKKYGIKKTNYFTDTVREVFADFELKMSEAIGRNIVFTLEKINRVKR